MEGEILILCDERDREIAESVRAELQARGRRAAVCECDAAADTLGVEPRAELARAAVAIVVVREGGRGNRLLHAVEDEPRHAKVLSVMADATPDGAVSARTAARIRTLGDTFAKAPGGVAKVLKAARQPRKGIWLAALATAILTALAVLWLMWPRQSSSGSAGGPDVVLTGMLSNSGWIVTFHLREEASRLEYKRPGDADFVWTGDAGPTSGPQMTAPHAKTYVILNDLHGQVPFQVRYRTPDGSDKGPYDVMWDTTAQSIAGAKNNLQLIPEWVAFRFFAGRHLCYFSALITYKYALRSIRYGVDSDRANLPIHFVPGETSSIDNDDQLMVDLPENASSVVVELVYLDGTTDKKTFRVHY